MIPVQLKSEHWFSIVTALTLASLVLDIVSHFLVVEMSRLLTLFDQRVPVRYSIYVCFEITTS